MKKTLFRNQQTEVDKSRRILERMQRLSALRASLYEAICRVDEELESIRRNESQHTRRFHQDNIQRVIPTKIHQKGYRGNIDPGNNGRNFSDLSESDYCRIGWNEV